MNVITLPRRGALLPTSRPPHYYDVEDTIVPGHRVRIDTMDDDFMAPVWGMFVEPPLPARKELAVLEHALVTGGYLGELEAYLGLHITPVREGDAA